MSKAKILWVDLEMTGLDPTKDKILEVAAIATDWDFKEVGRFESAVKVDDSLISARFKAGRDFWDANPDARDGLILQNSQAKLTSKQVEEDILKFTKEYF